MMLFKLSIKNIKKSFKDYAIYFFTLILGVAIFYVFNAIESQTVMLNITSSTRNIIDMMVTMLDGVSIVVSLILGFLIIYASRFLIKRRNREFGIYMTLGMSKRKISTILLFETILIGILSSIVGLAIGFLLSQAMSLFVANMFEADLTNFAFTFSKSACIKTFIYFGITYVFVMAFNTVSISKCKLIDLLHKDKKNEKVSLKNPLLSTLVFVLSIIVLGIAYYLVTDGIKYLNTADKLFIPILMGIISTFTLFWSLSGLILKIYASFKGSYYRGLNSFTVRQISSKINTTVFSMSIICLMLFVTICVLSSALSIKNSMSKNVEELSPVDIQVYKNVDTHGTLEDEVQVRAMSTRESLKTIGFNFDDLKDITEVSVYSTPSLTIKDSLGSTYESTKDELEMLTYYKGEELMKISDYNKIAKLYGREEYSLREDEYMIIANFDSWISVRDKALKANTKINLMERTLTPKFDTCKEGILFIGGSKTNTGIIIVPDNAVDESLKIIDVLSANYRAADKESRYNIEEKIENLEGNEYTKNMKISSKIATYEASIGLGGLVTFIGLYLGVIFLISSAAILALKELSESSDNKERYRMLRKIGADEHLIDIALFKTIAILFIFPLLVAIIHSIFGIRFCVFILETFGTDKLLPSIIMAAGVIVLIYGGYFLLTYLTSKNIIKD